MHHSFALQLLLTVLAAERGERALAVLREVEAALRVFVIVLLVNLLLHLLVSNVASASISPAS